MVLSFIGNRIAFVFLLVVSPSGAKLGDKSCAEFKVGALFDV